MLIKVGEKEYKMNLSSDAVENIEEHYGKSMDEIFAESKNLKAKDVNFILWCVSGCEGELDLKAFKKGLAQHYSYNQCIEMLTAAFGGDAPNEKAAVEVVAETVSVIEPL
jgi:hypothetical protein